MAVTRIAILLFVRRERGNVSTSRPESLFFFLRFYELLVSSSPPPPSLVPVFSRPKTFVRTTFTAVSSI